MVVMPHTGVQALAGAFKHSCTEPLMKTMSPPPAFLFAGLRSLSISSDLIHAYCKLALFSFNPTTVLICLELA